MVKSFKIKFFIATIFANLCCFSISLQANALLKREQDKFFISDDSCDLTKKHVNALEIWTKKIHKNSKCQIDNLEYKINSSDGRCHVEVSHCLPEHVLKYQDLLPEHSGPNCWNLSLVMKNILPGLRYTAPEEMAFYMKPPICRVLKSNEEREVGDIGAIRQVSKSGVLETHGFIYISEDLAYSKNGYSNHSPYAVQTLKGVLDLYNVPNRSECREAQKNLNFSCEQSVNYFRCDSFEDFLKKNPNISLPSKLALKNVMHFEQCLERATVKGEQLKSRAMSNIRGSINVLSHFYKQEAQKEKIGEEEAFVLGSLFFRLTSIAEQLDEMGKHSLAQESFILTDMIKLSAGNINF